nr:glycosyltransferase [Bradyrhizobium sp. URHD0069]
MRLSGELGISGHVEMPGHMTDVSERISKSDIFALPSRYEGFPNALIEAMQLETACVSFDCPSGPRVLIDDGCNGVLVPAEDVAALSEGLRKLAKDKVLRDRLAREAAKVSARFSTNQRTLDAGRGFRSLVFPASGSVPEAPLPHTTPQRQLDTAVTAGSVISMDGSCPTIS